MNASNEKRGPEEYDLVILGSGEGSKYLAWTLAGKGERVAVIERKYIGGSCPNIACLPSKNIIHSAKVASYSAAAKSSASTGRISPSMLNRLFLNQGTSGQPGRITAATVEHGEKR